MLSSTSGDQEKFGSQQGTQEPPAWAKELFQQQAEILEKLKTFLKGGKVGMHVWNLDKAPEHVLSVVA